MQHHQFTQLFGIFELNHVIEQAYSLISLPFALHSLNKWTFIFIFHLIKINDIISIWIVESLNGLSLSLLLSCCFHSIFTISIEPIVHISYGVYSWRRNAEKWQAKLTLHFRIASELWLPKTRLHHTVVSRKLVCNFRALFNCCCSTENYFTVSPFPLMKNPCKELSLDRKFFSDENLLINYRISKRIC